MERATARVRGQLDDHRVLRDTVTGEEGRRCAAEGVRGSLGAGNLPAIGLLQVNGHVALHGGARKRIADDGDGLVRVAGGTVKG